MNRSEFVVIGGGPGGYACAFRAADLGLKVTLIDARSRLGGVCLNEGCIPSKALLHAAEVIKEARHMSDWGLSFGEPSINLEKLRATKDGIVATLTQGLGGLAKRRKVTLIEGQAKFVGPNTLEVDGRQIEFEKAVIAAGSSPISLAGWPDDPRIWNSTSALELQRIPSRLTIVGGGIIGLEMATVYAALGSKVTVIEMSPQIAGTADKECTAILHQALIDDGITIHTETKVTEVTSTEAAIKLSCEGVFEGVIEADNVIQAVGRQANGRALSLEIAKVDMLDNGIIPVDEQCRTNQPNIFAIGDITGNPMLAHRATHQGHVAAEVAAGHPAAMESALVPSVAYTQPELAWVGLTEAQAKTEGIAVKTTSFPWAASGRNLASGGGAGLSKLLYCPQTQRILGGAIVGRGAGELLSEITLAIELGATLEDIALTVHAHPTLSETIAFSAERALGTLTDL